MALKKVSNLIERRLREMLDGSYPAEDSVRLDALKVAIAWQNSQRKGAPATPEDAFGWIKKLDDGTDDDP